SPTRRYADSPSRSLGSEPAKRGNGETGNFRSSDAPTPRYADSSSRLAHSTLVIIATVTVLLLASCKQGGAAAKPADVDSYTCTMRPSVRKQSRTDKCPICSMDLTPVKKKGVAANASAADTARVGHPPPGTADTNAPADDKPTEFTVAPERQQ